jgi:gliding motility-associated-like protein
MDELLTFLRNMNFRKIPFLLIFLVIPLYSSTQTIYLISSDGLWRLNLQNCVKELVVDVELSNVSDIAFHPDGTLYGIDPGGVLFIIDTLTGDTNFVHVFSGQLFQAMTCSKAGILYITGRDGELWTYDTNTGIATLLGNIGFGFAGDLTFFEGDLYMTSVNDDLIILIDLANLANSKIVMTDAGGLGGGMYGIVTDARDCNNVRFYGFISGNYIVSEVDLGMLTSDTVCILDGPVSGATTTHEFKASDPIRVTDTLTIHPDCGLANGSISITTIGGTPPYQFSLNGNPYQDGNTFENLAVGQYTIIAEDTRGCSTAVDITLIAGSADFIDSLVITDETCDGENGAITVVTYPIDNLQFSLDGSSFQTSNVFDLVEEGLYLVTVINEAGCIDTLPAEIVSIPSVIISDVQITSTTCGLSNGSISIVSQGGNDISYSTDGVSFQEENVFEQLPEGDFTVYIMDQNGCLDQELITIDASEPLMLDSLGIIHPTCAAQNGIATIYISNGNGALSYSLDQSSPQLSSTFDHLSEGMYAWTVQDDAGCMLTGSMELISIAFIEITSISTQAADCKIENGSITLQLTVPDNDFKLWINGIDMGNSTTVNDLPAGEYDLLLIDSSGGCKRDTTISIFQNQCTVVLANIFSPNGDGVNDVMELVWPTTDLIVIKQFSVFDRWGNIVHSISDVQVFDRQVLWDGSAQGKEAGPGVYTYLLQLENEQRGPIHYKGDITLIR